jgi:hypothetical protein
MTDDVTFDPETEEALDWIYAENPTWTEYPTWHTVVS